MMARHRYWAVAAMSTAAAACAATATGPDPAQLLAAGHAVEAERAYRAAVAADPGDPHARDGLGAALAMQGKYDQACPLLAIDSKPLSVDDCWLKGMESERLQQRWAMVAAYGKRADVSTWPHQQQVRFYSLYSEALRQQRDIDALLELYPRMLGVMPEDPDVHYYYARSLEARGHNERALREYELVLELDPEREEVRRYIRRLEQLMRQSGRSAATRVELLATPSAAQPASGDSDGVVVEDWSQGSMVAAISVEAISGDYAGPVSAMEVEVRTSVWPQGVEPDAILAQVASYAGSFKCPLPPGAYALVTWGPDGLVKAAHLEGVPAHSQACARRNINGWLLPRMRGGYLEVRTPIATARKAR